MKMTDTMSNRQSTTSGNALSENVSLPVGRRAFLIGTAVGAVVLATDAQTFAAPIGDHDIFVSPASIGYWHESDSHVLAGCPSNVTTAPCVCSARSVSVDTAPLNGSARVTVHGLFGSQADPDTTKIELIAHHYVNQSVGTVPVYLWGHRAGVSANQSASVRWVVPVDHNGGVRLSLVHQLKPTRPVHMSGAHNGTLDCSLVTNDGGGKAALRAGVYFITLGNRTPSAWGNCVFIPDDSVGGSRRLFRRTLSGMKPVDFPYIMVSVSPVHDNDMVNV